MFEWAVCGCLGILVGDRLDIACGWPVALALAGLLARVFRAARWGTWLAVAALGCSWMIWCQARDPGRAFAAVIPPDGCVLQATGVVVREPVGQGRLRVRLEAVQRGETALPGGATVLLSWPSGRQSPPKPQYGDRITFTATARNLSAPRNPGEFDAPEVLRRQGIYTQLQIRYANDATIVAHGQGNPLIAWSLKARRWIEKTLARDLEDSPAIVSVIQSMVLGSQGETPEEVMELFRHTGTIHLFSVSGIHVAMLGGIFFFLLQIAGVPRRRMAFGIIPLLWLYTFATGMAACTIRATVMASVFLLGAMLDRPALTWNALGASALLILGVDPQQLFRPGFQLSYLLVMVLLMAAKPLQHWFGRLGQPDPFLPRVLWSPATHVRDWLNRQIAGALGVSTAAWLASLPLTVYYFNLFSPASILANLLASALAWVILALSLASTLTGWFSTGLSILFNNTNWLCTKTLLALLSWVAAIPGGHRMMELPQLHTAPLVEATVFDLDGGGAVHLRIRDGGVRQEWMLDCGSASAYRHIVRHALRQRGVNTVEGLLLTHGDAAHVGGALELMADYPVKAVYDSAYRDRSLYRRTIHSALTDARRGKGIVRAGDRITLSPRISLNILYPPPGLSLRTADDKALVLLLEVNTTPPGGQPVIRRILFSSDAGFATEAWLAEHYPQLRAEVWVKGVHANDATPSAAWLSTLAPSVIVVAVPHSQPARLSKAWQNLAQRGIRLLRQDETGAVTLTIDAHGQWAVHPFLRSRAR